MRRDDPVATGELMPPERRAPEDALRAATLGRHNERSRDDSVRALHDAVTLCSSAYSACCPW